MALGAETTEHVEIQAHLSAADIAAAFQADGGLAAPARDRCGVVTLPDHIKSIVVRTARFHRCFRQSATQAQDHIAQPWPKRLYVLRHHVSRQMQ